jgi:dolichol-phosphate mannosyltransferase
MTKSFSILIPTFNEHDNITPLVERISAAIPGKDYEVVFVDDDSHDGTPELIDKLSLKYPVRVVVRKDKKGLASAVVDGFSLVSTNIIVVMDADLQHPPEVIPALIKALRDGADVAVASRYVPGGGTEGWSKTRKIISSGAIALAHLFLPHSRRVKDPMSGFFAFNKSAISGVRLEPIGYKILLEMLVVGKVGKVSEVPFKFQLRQKGESKLNASQEFEYLRHLFSLMRRSGELLRFVKFILVGLSGIIVNDGILWLLHGHSGWSIGQALLVSIEVSIITNFILNNTFTFADRHKPGFRHFMGNFLRFNFFSAPGGVLNWVTTVVLTDKSHYLIFNLIGIAIAMLWNYFANNLWTWKR